MLKCFGVDVKPPQLANLEASYALKMRNELTKQKLKMKSVSNLQMACYVFFSDGTMKFGHVNGSNVSFTSLIIGNMKSSLVSEYMKYLASGMGCKTPCDRFSNLAELVFKARFDDYQGFAFDPFEEDRMKLIDVISHTILKSRYISKKQIGRYVIYTTQFGITRHILWNPNDEKGLCVCLKFDNRHHIFNTVEIAQLYIVERHTLCLPLEPPNEFKSYSFGSYEIGQHGFDATIKLAELLMNNDNPSDNANGWYFISQLFLYENEGEINLNGIKRYLRCDDSIALIAITKFKSCRSNVVINSNGTYSAWSDSKRYETIYEWTVNGDDFECTSDTAIDRFLDDALSQSSSRPVSPIPPPPPNNLASHFQLLTRIDIILDAYLNYSMK